MAKPDKQITRDKVTVYQIKNDKPKNHVTSNENTDAEVVVDKSAIVKPINESTAIKTAVISDVDSTVVSDTVLLSTNVSTTTQPMATTTSVTTTTTMPLPTASSTVTTATTVTTTLLSTTSCSTVPSNTMSTINSNTMPVVTSDVDTSTVIVTKDYTSSVSDLLPKSTQSEEKISVTSGIEAEDVKPIIGQKRPATETSGPSTPKKTRASLRNDLQLLLEGKGSVSEDDTPKTPTKPAAITGLNNLKFLLFIYSY